MDYASYLPPGLPSTASIEEKMKNLKEQIEICSNKDEIDKMEIDIQYYEKVLRDYDNFVMLRLKSMLLQRENFRIDQYIKFQTEMSLRLIELVNDMVPPSKRILSVLVLKPGGIMFVMLSTRQLFQIYIGEDKRTKINGLYWNPLKDVPSEYLKIVSIKSDVSLNNVIPYEGEDINTFFLRFCEERKAENITINEASEAFDNHIDINPFDVMLGIVPVKI